MQIDSHKSVLQPDQPSRAYFERHEDTNIGGKLKKSFNFQMDDYELSLALMIEITFSHAYNFSPSEFGRPLIGSPGFFELNLVICGMNLAKG